MKTLVTMADIARRLGVHVSTVSLALRDHHSIPPDTRMQVRKTANLLGYKRDPLLDAFNRRLNVETPVRGSKEFLFITTEDPSSGPDPEIFSQVVEGAATAAMGLGNSFELVQVGGTKLPLSRIPAILRTRGACGVLLHGRALFDFFRERDWPNLCVLVYGCDGKNGVFDHIDYDYHGAFEYACAQLRRRGCVRLGFLLSHSKDSSRQRLLLNAFQAYQYLCPADQRVSPLSLCSASGSGIVNQIKDWLARESPDAVISDSSDVMAFLLESGANIPEALRFVSLGVSGLPNEISGIVPAWSNIGIQAIERLNAMYEACRCGVPASPLSICVQGAWNEGTTIVPGGKPHSMGVPPQPMA